MKIEASTDYKECILIAKDSMTTYYEKYDLEWDHAKRLELLKPCEIFKVKDSVEIGFFMFWVRDSDFYIADIQVLKEHRNKGYGGKILSHVKRVAKSRGHDKIWLKVFKNSPALKLYQKNGYVLEREEESVYVLSANT